MSRALLDEHRRIWARKPVLAKVYGVWFDLLLETAPPRGRVLEVGSGPGLLADYVRKRRPDLEWIAADVLAAPWQGVVANCLRIPLGAASVDAVVALDTLHHLAQPARFFEEVARVLRPGGHLATVEPWVTPMSFPIYRFLHQEGCTLGLDPWNPFSLGPGADKDAFDGDAAVVFRLIRGTSADRWRRFGLEPPRYRVLNGFAYLLSMGFQPPSFLPPWASSGVMALDRALSWAAPLLGMRVMATWRTATPAPGPAGA